MQISGNLLPSPSSSLNQGLSDNRQSLAERKLDTEQKNRQQTVEYVFQGEILEEVGAEQQNQNRYSQTIHPANQTAISSYAETDAIMPRQGNLVDIFI